MAHAKPARGRLSKPAMTATDGTGATGTATFNWTVTGGGGSNSDAAPTSFTLNGAACS